MATARDFTNRFGTTLAPRGRATTARIFTTGGVKPPRALAIRKATGSKTMTGKFKPMLGSMARTLRTRPLK